MSLDLRRAQGEVSRLSTARREIVQQLRDHGLSHGVIAAHLGVTRSAVLQMLRPARHTLGNETLSETQPNATT